jgi:glycosyltransferase involved in cell wall biosynthesis
MKVLGLFFTRGVSLRQWVETGLFDREVLVYRDYLNSREFAEIIWLTYGESDSGLARELQSQGRLPNKITVIAMPAWIRRLGRFYSVAYLFYMPLFAYKSLRVCTVYKTNQMDGALAAIIAAKLYRKPLYVRTGYTLSMFVDQIHVRNPLRRGFAWLTERLGLFFCDAISVASKHDRDYLIKRYGLSITPSVIGNYVDVDLFSPRENVVKQDRLIFIGRLTKQKNLIAGIIACASVGVGLDIVGDGPDKEMLQTLAQELHADVRWMGTFPNDDLPELMSSYRYFFIPSLWEGMPKALLEAMAVGLVCIGNNSSGINEIIQDGVTGFLSSGPDAGSLEYALSRALCCDAAAVTVTARAFICENFSLQAVASRESAIFSAISVGVAVRENT